MLEIDAQACHQYWRIDTFVTIKLADVLAVSTCNCYLLICRLSLPF